MSARVLTKLHWGDEHAKVEVSRQRQRVAIDFETSLLAHRSFLPAPSVVRDAATFAIHSINGA